MLDVRSYPKGTVIATCRTAAKCQKRPRALAMPISASLSIRYAGAVGSSFFASVIINWDMSGRTSRPAYQFKSATETRGQVRHTPPDGFDLDHFIGAPPGPYCVLAGPDVLLIPVTPKCPATSANATAKALSHVPPKGLGLFI